MGWRQRGPRKNLTSCPGLVDHYNTAIKDATYELCSYSKGSGEYQIVKGEIERLTAFKARLIDSVEV